MNVLYAGGFPVHVPTLGLTLEPGQTTNDALDVVEATFGRRPTLDRAVLVSLLLQAPQYQPADDDAERALLELLALAGHPPADPSPEPTTPAPKGRARKTED